VHRITTGSGGRIRSFRRRQYSNGSTGPNSNTSHAVYPAGEPDARTPSPSTIV